MKHKTRNSDTNVGYITWTDPKWAAWCKEQRMVEDILMMIIKNKWIWSGCILHRNDKVWRS